MRLFISKNQSIFAFVAVGLFIAVAASAWTNPSQTPPNGNVSLPSAQWTANGNNIYNENSGNVGIGTTVPSEKLDVSGNLKVSGTIRGASYGFGGLYETIDGQGCVHSNPITSGCSCPSGFTDAVISRFNDANSQTRNIYMCWK